MLEKAKNPQFWQEVRNNPQYEWIIERVKKAYDDNRQDKILNLMYLSVTVIQNETVRQPHIFIKLLKTIKYQRKYNRK